MEWLILIVILGIVAWIVEGELRRRQEGQRGQTPRNALRTRPASPARPARTRTRVFTPTQQPKPVAKRPAPSRQAQLVAKPPPSPDSNGALRAARIVDDPSRPCWVTGFPREACTCPHCERHR